MTHDPDFAEWLTEARAGSFETAMQLCNFRPNKGFERAVDRAGPCPACGGDDRFSVHMNKRVFNCRKCGVNGNDAVGLAMVGKERGEFIGVCEELAGRPRPGKQISEHRPIDHEREAMMRDADRDRAALVQQQDRQVRARKANFAEQVWNNALRFTGSRGEEYFRVRRLDTFRNIDDYLGFLPDYPVIESKVEIGRWPCVVAPMRNRHMEITGLHCTFLDHEQPIKAELWATDERGERYRVPSKRTYGTIGIVWLSEVKAEVAAAEGVETARGWMQCGAGDIGDYGLISACNLGNLSGGSLGSRPHPQLKGRTIPNGVPDPEKPGFLDYLPPAVKSVLMLGDCDLPAHNGLAHYQAQARRCIERGMDGGLQFPLAWPWDRKFDWADLAKYEAEQADKERAA